MQPDLDNVVMWLFMIRENITKTHSLAYCVSIHCCRISTILYVRIADSHKTACEIIDFPQCERDQW